MEIVEGMEIEHKLAEPTDEQDITHLGDDAKAKELAVRFAKNIEQFSDAPAKVKAAGPKI